MIVSFYVIYKPLIINKFHLVLIMPLATLTVMRVSGHSGTPADRDAIEEMPQESWDNADD